LTGYLFGFKSGTFNDGFVGGIATNQFIIETGGLDGGLSIQPWLWSYGGNDLSYSIAHTSARVLPGQTVDFSQGNDCPTYLGTEPNTSYYIGLQSDGYFGVATLRLDNGTVGGNGYGFVLDRIALIMFLAKELWLVATPQRFLKPPKWQPPFCSLWAFLDL
jgi:hypothetical protein